jgi:hypothetical protein
MSTVPKRQASSSDGEGRPERKSTRRNASFDYGYRYVQVKRRDGTVGFKMVPLTL